MAVGSSKGKITSICSGLGTGPPPIMRAEVSCSRRGKAIFYEVFVS